ncbi:MAG: ABC transporter ATP-binding protein [Rectinemataceae bacterium]|jgi:putative spermidine/putrescine transport system ATP-binding protein
MKDFKRISVRRMTKRFGDKTAVHDFSLELGKGEFVAFLGPSGCGKSTALNCITGLIPLTSGEIFIDDECIDDSRNKVPPEKREFGMVFQNYALFPHLTVRENVAFGLKLRRLGKAEVERRVGEVLRLVHLEGYAAKYPTQMSGGEQQRVAIARCIVLEPRLLLLDEPLSNLDAKLRVELRYELKALHERLKVTTIYVTHDQTEALALSDRIVVLNFGRIQQVGPPSEIFSNPSNPFVADFVGYKNAWAGGIEALKETPDGLEVRIRVQKNSLDARLPYPAGDPRREGIVAAFRSGSPVCTAIRPEDIVAGSRPGANSLRCVANLVEYQGHTSQVRATLENPASEGGAGALVDMRSSVDVAMGEIVEASIATDRILLFPEGLPEAAAS